MNASDEIFRMVDAWSESCEPDDLRSSELREIRENLEYLERVKFQPFVPTLYSKFPASFIERLHAWLHNPGIEEEQQRDLFEFAGHIVFFSFDDFTALFRSIFTGSVTRWCMEQSGIRLDTPDWSKKLDDERYKKTWFCPITDSLLISVFHHVNQIEDKDHKPSFRDLAKFGDAEEVLKYIQKNGFERLVLLEDFVGTGTQSFKAVKWALRNLDIPVMFCPILIAEGAAGKYRHLNEKLRNGNLKDARCPDFAFEPAFKLSADCFVYDNGTEPSPLFKRITDLAEAVHARLSEAGHGFQQGPFGFWDEDSPQKGAAVVTFSNTPNNSLPLIWDSVGGEWNALFPRVTRKLL